MRLLEGLVSLFRFYLIIVITTNKIESRNSQASPSLVSLNLISKAEVVRRLAHERQLQIHQTEALYQGYGTHYVDIWVGTPIPQRLTLMVDTGNSITAFPCETCRGCGSAKNHNFYNYSDSDTFYKSTCNDCKLGTCLNDLKICEISMEYAEGSSWNGFEARDIAYFGENDNKQFDQTDPRGVDFELSFGCQTQESSHFIYQLEDGILGLSKKKLGTLWHQMYLASKISEKSFSLCLRQPIEGMQGKSMGVMSLGGYNSDFHKSPMVFAHDYGTDKYTVYVEAVYLRANGGESMTVDVPAEYPVHKINISDSQLNSEIVIVDSGSTYTYFNEKIMGPFKETWREITGFDYSTGASYSFNKADILRLPTFLIQMRVDQNSATIEGVPNRKNIIVAVPASQYMEYKRGKYSPRLYINKSGLSILGTNTMVGHDVFFDLENDRIGWAESTCRSDEYNPESR